MTCANNLTIKMNNKAAATAAVAAAKNVLATTSIKEPHKGEFAKLSDCLMVKKNTISGLAGIWVDTCELILPEILKAIAAQGNKFSGNNYWESDYDTEYWEFSFDGKELTMTSNFHCGDEEPVCQECDEEVPYEYDEDNDCYVCPECGHEMSTEEYEAHCETSKIQKFTF
jgi:hypothetical protein